VNKFSVSTDHRRSSAVKKRNAMPFKFEKLEVWQLSLEYHDLIYDIAKLLPDKERYNLKSQMVRAVTSISLNIAEGSTSQTNPEFRQFIKMAIRSSTEVIGCLHLVKRKNYIDSETFNKAYAFGEKLFAKLQALYKSLSNQRTMDR
jgi:four helix bundle protein